MRRFAFAMAGSAVCVCCVLPAYEGVDMFPDGGQGGGGKASAGATSDAGNSNLTQAVGGEGANTGTAGSSANAGSANGGTANGGTKNEPQAGTANGGTEPTLGGAGGEGGAEPIGPEVPCPANVLGHCAVGETYPAYAGYTLALVEDFPVAINLDTDPIFTWSDGQVSDGQTGFRKENISFADGKMILKATTDCAATTNNANCYPARMSYAEAKSPNKTANVAAHSIWSGELRSKYNNYRYGRYEAKFKAPAANPGFENDLAQSGGYLATLFVFRSPANVQWNEIDIMAEAYKPTYIFSNVVNAANPPGYPGGADGNNAGPSGFHINQEHVYAFTWTPTKIEWFVDGTSIRSYDGSGTTKIPTMSAKIMMSLWVFSGNYFGDPKYNKYPFQTEYEYFRFYKLNTETKYPCTNPPACLDTADKTQSAQNNPNELNYGL